MQHKLSDIESDNTSQDRSARKTKSFNLLSQEHQPNSSSRLRKKKIKKYNEKELKFGKSQTIYSNRSSTASEQINMHT